MTMSNEDLGASITRNQQRLIALEAVVKKLQEQMVNTEKSQIAFDESLDAFERAIQGQTNVNTSNNRRLNKLEDKPAPNKWVLFDYFRRR